METTSSTMNGRRRSARTRDPIVELDGTENVLEASSVSHPTRSMIGTEVLREVFLTLPNYTGSNQLQDFGNWSREALASSEPGYCPTLIYAPTDNRRIDVHVNDSSLAHEELQRYRQREDRSSTESRAWVTEKTQLNEQITSLNRHAGEKDIKIEALEAQLKQKDGDASKAHAVWQKYHNDTLAACNKSKDDEIARTHSEWRVWHANELNEKFKAKDNEIAKLQAAHNTSDETCDTLRNEVTKKENDMKTLIDEKAELKEKLKSNAKRCDELLAQVTQSQENCRGWVDAYENCKAECDRLRIDATNKEGEISTLKDKKAVLDADVALFQDRCRQWINAHNLRAAERDTLQGGVTNKNRDITNLRNENTQMNAELTDALAMVERKENRVRALEDSLTSTEEQLWNLVGLAMTEMW